MAMDGKFGVYMLPWPRINCRSRPTTTLERAFRMVGLGVMGRFSSSLEPENLPPTPIPPTRNARSRVVVGTGVKGVDWRVLHRQSSAANFADNPLGALSVAPTTKSCPRAEFVAVDGVVLWLSCGSLGAILGLSRGSPCALPQAHAVW